LLASGGPAAVAKHGLTMLRALILRLSALPEFEPAAIHLAIEHAAKEEGLANMGPLAQTVRIAITGTTVSPPLGEALAVLGRGGALLRLNRCVEWAAAL